MMINLKDIINSSDLSLDSKSLTFKGSFKNDVQILEK